MKRLAAVALIVAGIAIPACAQRGSSRGGFSGQSGPSIHGGFSGPAPSQPMAPPRNSATRPPYAPQGSRRSAPGNFSARSGVPDRSGPRPPYRRPNRFGWGIPNIYSGWYPGWSGAFDPNYLGYPDNGANDDSSAAMGNAPQGSEPQDYAPQPDNQGAQEPPPWPSYNPPQPAAAPQSSEPVTLVFNDGTPTELIHNYVLTPAALYIYDQRRREIPIAHIDLVATAKANHDAGVDFNLPVLSR
jgi:hypothetical protein